MMSLTKLTERRVLAAAGLAAAIAIPAHAQVVPPPEEKPEQTPAFTPPPPPPPTQANPRAATNRPAVAPDVPFEPITKRGDDGAIVELDEPIEYAAIAHNPLVDLVGLSRMGAAVQQRRARVEAQVIANLDLLTEVDGGFIQSIRTGDEESFRPATMRLVPLLMAAGQARTLTDDLVGQGAMLPTVGALTQKIMSEHNSELIADANAREDEGDLTTDDRVLHATLGTSLSEITYYYRRLALEAADSMGAIMDGLELSDEAAAAAAPVLAKLENEADLDKRSELARELIAALPSDARARAFRAVIEARPDVDGDGLLTLADGAVPKQLDNEMRKEILMSLVDGVAVDTSGLVD